MYHCCIFDLDGTLINTIHALERTINLTLSQYGLGPIDQAHTKLFVGDGYQKFVQRALAYCGDRDLAHYQDALSLYDQYFKENCLYKIAPYDGMPQLLGFLKSKGAKLAVVTNKSRDRAVENLDMVYGPGIFDRITGDGEGIGCKPDPSGVLLTLEAFGIGKDQCLYLGDTNTDMETAANAGVDAVGVTWGFRDKKELMAYHPKFLASHPKEVEGIFLS